MENMVIYFLLEHYFTDDMYLLIFLSKTVFLTSNELFKENRRLPQYLPTFLKFIEELKNFFKIIMYPGSL